MEKILVHDKVFIKYLEEAEIQGIVRDLSLQIYEDYKDTTPVFIGVLNGVVVFLADLLKSYPGSCEIGFIQMSSYVGTTSTGIVYKKLDLTKEIKGRHVVILEDIVDTGNTLESLLEYLKSTQSPQSVKLACLFFKPEVYKKKFKIDYIGKDIPDKFVVGYGLDYDGLGRNSGALYQLSS